MKDRLQNLAIVVLLFSSIILFFLNFGIKISDFMKEEKTQQGNIIFSSSALMSDALMPEYIGINFGGDFHTVISNPNDNDFWKEASGLFQEIFEDKKNTVLSIDNIAEDLFRQLMYQKSIFMTFNKSIPTLTLLNSMGIEDTKDFVEKFPNIESLYISLERPFVVIKNNNKEVLISIEELNTESLSNKVSNLYLEGFNPYGLADSVFNNGKTGYVPMLSQHKIKSVTFTNILSTLDSENIEKIVYKFFGKELNFIREIKEEGVQTIYVDGDKILKISEDGLISYFNPEKPTVVERNLYISLETALSFISNNLGFDDSLYLKAISQIEVNGTEGFKIIFGKNSKGYKVEIADENIVDYIEIDVFNEHIRRFSQYFRGEATSGEEKFKPDESQNIKNVLERNLEGIKEELHFPKNMTLSELMRKIDYANVVYKDKGDNNPLGFEWQIKIENRIFEFEIKQ